MVTGVIDSKFYTNSGLEELTRHQPVRTVLGSLYYLSRLDGVLRADYGASVFRDSPANNREAEILIGNLVMNAAQQDRWVGCESRLTTLDMAHFKGAANRSRLSEHKRGLLQALEARLIELEVFDRRVYAVPTESLVNFVYERLQQLRSKKTSLLTEKQSNALLESARFDYRGSIRKGVSKKLGLSPVKDHLYEIFKRLEVHDAFAAVYKALDIGVLYINDILPSEKLSQIIKKLTAYEKGILRTLSAYALKKGRIDIGKVATRLRIKDDSLRRSVLGIHSKADTSNYAQLAVIAYAYVQTRSQ